MSSNGGWARSFGVAVRAGSVSTGMGVMAPSAVSYGLYGGAAGAASSAGSSDMVCGSRGSWPSIQTRMSRVPSFHTTLLGTSPTTSKYTLFMFDAPQIEG